MKMKIGVSILLMAMIPNGLAAVYWTAFGWAKGQYDIDLQAKVKAMKGPIVQNNKPLLTANFNGFGLKGDKLLQISGTTFGNPIGRLEKCAGLGNTCIVVDGKFKIFLPKDFDFKTKKSWQWKGYVYNSEYKYQSELFGVSINVVDVTATCVSCDFPIFGFSIDEQRGITEMVLLGAEEKSNYVLSDGTGFYAKDKAGNYTF